VTSEREVEVASPQALEIDVLDGMEGVQRHVVKEMGKHEGDVGEEQPRGSMEQLHKKEPKAALLYTNKTTMSMIGEPTIRDVGDGKIIHEDGVEDRKEEGKGNARERRHSNYEDNVFEMGIHLEDAV